MLLYSQNKLMDYFTYYISHIFVKVFFSQKKLIQSMNTYSLIVSSGRQPCHKLNKLNWLIEPATLVKPFRLWSELNSESSHFMQSITDCC